MFFFVFVECKFDYNINLKFISKKTQSNFLKTFFDAIIFDEGILIFVVNIKEGEY